MCYESWAHHVQLPKRCREMQRCPRPVVLGHKVGISLHYERQLLWVAQPNGRVEGERGMPGLRRIAARAAHVPHGCQLLV